MKKWIRYSGLLAITTVFLCFPTLSSQSSSKNRRPSQAPVLIPEVQSGEPFPSDLFIQIAKKINPSVVSISTTLKVSRMSHPQDLLDLFFSTPFEREVQPRNRPPQSLGSGFILESDGYIVTNAHVVDKVDSILVQLKDDPTIYKAQIIGKDPATDVALIKINIQDSRTRKTFPKVDLGDSNALQVGETVVAFGNPFGHSNTMTKGIISALDRSIDEINLLPFLQTDASINPGNSGGPLVNTKGQVIGVNTAINPRAVNIGFAIPIYNVKSILKALKQYGYVKRGFIGVQMDVNTVEFDFKGKSYKGVLIVNVAKGGPADKAGILPQDIITEFNKSPIKSSKDLFKIVSASPVNEKVGGRLFRNQRMRSFQVRIQERPHQKSQAQKSSLKRKSSNSSPFQLGFKLAQADTKLPSHLNLPLSYANRPIVIEVSKNSPSGRAGLKEGDIIFSVNGSNVQTIGNVFKRLTSQKENILHVLRYDQPGRYSLKQITIIKK